MIKRGESRLTKATRCLLLKILGTASVMKGKPLVHVLLTGAVILGITLARADDRALLPKYGSLPKTESQKAADAKFIAAIDQQYHGDRNKASADLATRGWQYLAEGNLDDAMRRFNQAWLLNNNNGAALWGMAAIQAGSAKFDESLQLFAEAEKFVGGDINFSTDYAKALAMAGASLKNDDMLKDAFVRFERIYEKAPQNTTNLQNWAIALFIQGRYSESWAKVKLAEATPNKDQLDPRFLAALKLRMPRPQD
jgi:tetratricopeptide (TPR) repeat protein